MGFWLLFFIGLGFQILGELLRPKPKQENAKPSGLGDFRFPTTDATRVIQLFRGTCKLDGPNVPWFGDLKSKAIKKKVKTGLFSSQKVLQGYKYFLGVQCVFGYGEIDELVDILFDDKSIFGDDAKTGTNGGYGASGAFASLTPGNSLTVGDIEVFDEGDYFEFTMDNPELLGNDDPKNGVAGPVKLYKGTYNQPSNDYLQGQWGEVETSGFRPLCYAVLEHCYLGNSTTPPPMALVARCTPNPLALTDGKHNIAGDDNPANFCYEVLTDQLWGLKISATKIDIDSFVECGNTLAEEGLGVSMVIDSAMKGRTLLTEILRHVDGVIYPDPQTGLYTMKLARADYDIEDLPVFDITNVDPDSIEFSRISWADTKNTTIINYLDRDSNFQRLPSKFQNPANVYARRGQIDYEQIDFLGFSNKTNANYMAARANKTQSSPLCRVQFECNRAGWTVRPGSVLRFHFPTLNLNNVILRVVDINYGNLNEPKIQITGTEDIFAVSDFAFDPAPDTGFEPPSAINPEALLYSDLLEVPYQLIQNEARIVGALGVRDDATSVTGFEVWADDEGGTDYVQRDRADGVLCGGTLQVGFTIGDANLTIENVQDPTLLDDATDEEVAQGLSLLVVGNEIMAWKTHVVNMDGSVTFSGLVPGVFDTLPDNHALSTPVFILNASIPVTSPTGYSEDLTITAKLPTFTPSASLDLDDTPQKTITTQSRAERPNPPGNFQINGDYPWEISALAGTLTITFAHRNKLTDMVVAQEDPSTSLEPGVTYTMRAYNDDTDALLLEQTNIASTSISFAWAASLNMRIELVAVDSDGDESLYPQTAIFAYTTGGSTIIDVVEEDPAVVSYNFPTVEAVAIADVASLSGAQTVDGVSLVAGDRVLLTAQTTGTQNGIYVVKAGAWVRAADADASAKFFAGKQVFVRRGSAKGDTLWIVSNDGAITLGATTITFAEIGAGGVAVSSDFSPVRTVATANLPALSGLLTIEGIVLVAGDRVLVPVQTTGAQNGIYVAAAGAWTRATDADATGDFSPGKQVFVQEGNLAGSLWANSNTSAVTVGSTTITFTYIGGRNQQIATLGVTFDAGNDTIEVGKQADLYIPFDCTILDWVLLSVETGNIVIDVWSDVYGSFPPTDADSITAASQPTVSGGNKATDSTLTGWTKALTAGSTLRFNVDSATVKHATLSLHARKH